MPSALPDTTALHPTGASCERREALECGSLLPLFSASLLAVSRMASRNRVAFAGRHLIEVQNGDTLEGRRPGNVIAQTKRGTSAGLGHAAVINQPWKGGIELNGRGYFAPAGLVRSPAGTQGCARSSLTLGYYIAGPSALSLGQLSITPGFAWVWILRLRGVCPTQRQQAGWGKAAAGCRTPRRVALLALLPLLFLRSLLLSPLLRPHQWHK